MLISIKKLSICKVYIYYEFLVVLTNGLLPVVSDNNSYNDETGIILQMTLLFNFMTLYFKFWPSLLCSMSVLTLKFVMRAVMDFEEFSQGTTIITDLINLIWLFAAILTCHCVITKIGTIFVEAQIMRTDSQEKLLNDLDDQGVIILKKETHKVEFINKAIKHLKIFCDEKDEIR